MKKIQNIACQVILVLIAGFLLSACNKEKDSNPPVIKLFVNDVEVTTESTVQVAKASRLEYRYEISASATIADIKTVLTDVSNPDLKKNREVLVTGLANSLNETVKGVLFPTFNMEVMLVVKDIDGNEVSKTFSITVI